MRERRKRGSKKRKEKRRGERRRGEKEKRGEGPMYPRPRGRFRS